MSDKYGSVQPRALETSGLSWDSIILPQGVPMGSSDAMLPGLVANEKAANVARVSTPSGWLRVGEVLDAADKDAAILAAPSGAVICSTGYSANTFGLMSRGTSNLAVVNGWVLNVTGTDTTGKDNLIVLGSMDGVTSGRTDLVFLEVWREQITKDSTVYPNGNDYAGSTLANDLVNPLAGVETTQRVQVKYRIRTVDGGISDLSSYPDGISPSTRAQGAKPDGTVTAYGFQNQSANGDAGLWCAGAGDDASRTSLGTVDGYVYAIPMFAVYRRGNDIGFSINKPDISATALYPISPLVPSVSDRPDGLYFDAVYADDIVDLRHSLSQQSDALQKTFQRALDGSLRTRRGLVRSTTGYTDAPGGSLISKGETLGNAVAGVLPVFGTASMSPLVRRASFCNASVSTHGTVITYTPASPWAIGTLTDIDLVGSSPYIVTSVYGGYGATTHRQVWVNNGTDVHLVLNDTTMDLTVLAGSWLIGTSEPLCLQMGVVSKAGSFGVLDVPRNFLSALDNVTGTTIPVSETPVRIPRNPRSSVDGSHLDEVLYLSPVANSTWRQGVDLRTHQYLVSPSSLTVTLVGGKKYGYEVVGVKSVQFETSPGSGVFGDHKTFSVTRTKVSTSGNVEFLIGSLTSSAGVLARVTFSVKTKSLELSRQGRGVTAIYETLLVSPVYDGANYLIDTGDKPILAVGSSTATLAGYVSGTPYAYVGSTVVVGSVTTETVEKRLLTLDTGVNLPLVAQTDYTSLYNLPTRVRVHISGTVAPSNNIYVPVVVMSYLEPADSFSLFYKTTGYQGTSSSVGFPGTVLAEGPAATSSSGSGAVTDYSYDPASDKALFTAGSRTVSLVTGADWSSHVRAGDRLWNDADDRLWNDADDRLWNDADGDALLSYVVASSDPTTITLEEPYKGTTSPGGGDLFYVTRKDSPEGVAYCVLDRMPTGTEDGYSGESAPLDGLYGTRYLSKRLVRQSPLDSWQEDAQVGYGAPVTSGARGLKGLQLSVSGQNPAYPLNYAVPAMTYDAVSAINGTYRKTYQSLLYREQSTGRTYMAVVSSAPGNNDLIADSLVDVVDIFELVGRPLIRG